MILAKVVTFGLRWDEAAERSHDKLKRGKKMVALRLLSRQWIVDEEGKIIIGEGRREIFENIEKTGSINQTAKVMKMSYKGVWSKIKATESTLKMRVVDTNKKRGSSLTDEGKALLKKYIELKEQCLEADDRVFKNIFSENPLAKEKD
jgi:molybdate transport system regulatory protein